MTERPSHQRLVSITLVAFNGMRWLPECLASVGAQTHAAFELLILDNASEDGSLVWLREQEAQDSRIHVWSAERNEGFARAQNRLIERARGEAVLLLNQDVILDPDFLAAALRALDEHPEAASVQPRLRRLDPTGARTDRLDSTGLVMGRDRRAVSRGQGEQDGPAHEVAGPVFGADGPAPLYRRAALLDARLPRSGGGWEILDEDFFMYKEDVDLAWRVRRLGWIAWYAPEALAWHARTAPGTSGGGWLGAARTTMAVPAWIRAISWRNQRLTQVKNDPLAAVFRDLPWIVGRELASMAFLILADPGRLTILPSLVRALPGTMRKRRALERKVSARTRLSQGGTGA